MVVDGGEEFLGVCGCKAKEQREPDHNETLLMGMAHLARRPCVEGGLRPTTA